VVGALQRVGARVGRGCGMWVRVCTCRIYEGTLKKGEWITNCTTGKKVKVTQTPPCPWLSASNRGLQCQAFAHRTWGVPALPLPTCIRSKCLCVCFSCCLSFAVVCRSPAWVRMHADDMEVRSLLPAQYELYACKCVTELRLSLWPALYRPLQKRPQKRPYKHTYKHTSKHPYKHTHKYPYKHPYKHPHKHTQNHTYKHTQKHTHKHISEAPL